MAYRHIGSQPVYYPNSYGGPEADPSTELPTWSVDAGEIGRYAYENHAADDDFVQPRALYRDVMDETDRDHLVTNIVAHAGDNVSDDVQRRVVGYWTNVDSDLGARVAAGLGHGNGAASLSEANVSEADVQR
jgi:catalase